jgi:DNA polymerase/3'-5' exonuclease PolX
MAAKVTEDLMLRIPRDEVSAHVAFITKHAPSAMVAGSYRRGAATSSDIDIVLREPIATVVKRLTDAGYVHSTFAMGAKKFSGVVRLPKKGAKYRHLDLVTTTPKSYPFAMLYFTGPAQANVIMRVKAKRQGYRLNEYGLWKIGRTAATPPTLVPGITTEKDIYAALGLPYKEPDAR